MEPEIRFKGFEGEWEKVKLGNVCSVNRGTRITKKELNTNQSYPVYQNTNYPLGYYKNYNVEANNPYVIIGGSAGLIGFSNVPFWAADDCAYFGDNDSLDKTFLYSTLLFHIAEIKRNVRGSSVPRLDRSTLIDLETNLPSFSEQQSIATYFRTLDNKIQSTSKKLASLKKLKSASLVAMFPQQGETTPKVRFKGFEGEWKTPSIGYVFELRNGYTPSKIVKEFWEGGTIPWFRMEDIRMNGGFLKDALQHITPWAVKGAGLFEKNSIILATTATIGVHAMLIADSLANQRFTNFKVRKSLSDEYIDEFIYYSFFKIDEWSKNNTNSGGLLSVNMPLLVKQSFLTPCKEEQQAIATFFRSLDRKIALETARLEKLKQIKLACLDKMFV